MPSLTAALPRVAKIDKRHWVATAVLVAVAALNLFAGFSLLGDNAAARSVPDLRKEISTAPVAPPAPEPLQFRAVAPQDAIAINAAVPIAAGPNPAAKPFNLSTRGEDKARALDCLTSAIYYEAATEPTDGLRAVAQVVLNRVRHPAFPNSVCGVVYQGAERATGCQFTFTCDGALRRLPMKSYWDRARKIAEEALNGAVFAPVGLATHYHTDWVVPYWSSTVAKVANIGSHIFYRWAGGWGRPPAFAQRYSGTEPAIDLAALRARVPVVQDPVDLAAAEAARKAKAEDAIEADSSVDSFQRAVLRRYEPSKGPPVGELLADAGSKTDPADKDAASHRWAMTGEGLATSGPPLGRPGSSGTIEPVKPLAPTCASTVQKVGEAQPAACRSGG